MIVALPGLFSHLFFFFFLKYSNSGFLLQKKKKCQSGALHSTNIRKLRQEKNATGKGNRGNSHGISYLYDKHFLSFFFSNRHHKQ